MDFISIDHTELEMAQRAMITGKVAVFRGGSVAGNHIISITPDWNKELGLNPDYQLKGEDMADIPRIKQNGYQQYLLRSNEKVVAQLSGGNRPLLQDKN